MDGDAAAAAVAAVSSQNKFSRWMHEMNPEELGNSPSAASDPI